MAEIGDRVAIAANKVGQVPREGIVRAKTGNLIRVEWESGEESTLMPAPGTLTVLRRGRGAGGAKKAAPSRTPAAGKAAPSKKAVSKKAVSKAVAKKPAPAKTAAVSKKPAPARTPAAAKKALVTKKPAPTKKAAPAKKAAAGRKAGGRKA